MWPFSEREVQDEVVVVPKVEPAKKPILTLDSITRDLPKKQPDTHREVLDKAASVLHYRPKDVLLNNVLAELEIETLNHEQVVAYMDSKNEGHGVGRKNFMQYKLQEYKHPIPVHVLNKAIQIKERLPEAEFLVFHYEEGDPFLWVMHNEWGWYIEVWEEPTFEGRVAKPKGV